MTEPTSPEAGSSEATTLRRLGAAAILMVAAVLLSRVVGFLREMFIAARFGVTWETDAYNAAFTIPDWLNYLVAGGTLSITFLPIYAGYLAKGEEREANHVLSVVMSFVLVVVGIGVLAFEIGATPILSAYFHDMDPRALEATIRYTRILLPAQLCFVAGGVLNATLFARGHFGAAALAPLIYNIAIIVGGVALGGSLGVEGLAWGALAGAFIGPFLVPALHALKKGALFHPTFALRHPGFVSWLKLSLPLMIGVSLVTADDWILRYFASAETGEITRLNYAKRLVAVAIAVAGQAIGQASMPFFSRLFAEGKRLELADTFARTARSACVFAMLVAAWMIALAEPVIDLLFRRGKFSIADVSPTATYLAIFAAAIPLWTLQAIASRAFYAARNTLTPMIASTIVLVVSLPIYAFMFHHHGPVGLAVASGIGVLGHTAALLALAPRLLPELREVVRPHLRSLGAGALLSALAGAAAWLTARSAADAFALSGHLRDVALIAIASVSFLVVTVALARPMGVTEPLTIVRKLHIRRRGR